MSRSPLPERYEGTFEKGELVYGTITKSNGKKYIGSFKNGKLHGKGKEIDKRGFKYEGQYIDGNLQEGT
ncbi:hypothetical protein LCGC14_2525200 [marine sediment metagenome]|uniref:MORN repeat-containing protein n=1 Tax=marine sediment metagenome TaxID=412755 RepID=A0A0F9AVN6_9ZZZZ